MLELQFRRRDIPAGAAERWEKAQQSLADYIVGGGSLDTPLHSHPDEPEEEPEPDGFRAIRNASRRTIGEMTKRQLGVGDDDRELTDNPEEQGFVDGTPRSLEAVGEMLSGMFGLEDGFEGAERRAVESLPHWLGEAMAQMSDDELALYAVWLQSLDSARIPPELRART